MKPTSLAEEIAKVERKARVLTPVLGSELSLRTTLVNEILAERAEMLRMLDEAVCCLGDHGPAAELSDAIVAFLSTRTAGKETG
jgi:hypothetical protein